MDVLEIRRRRVRQLIATRFGGIVARFALAIGRSGNQVARWFMDDPVHRRNVGERLARDVERKLGLPAGWLDEDTPGPVPPTPQLKRIRDITQGKRKLGHVMDLLTNWLTPEQLEVVNRDYLYPVVQRMMEMVASNAEEKDVLPDDVKLALYSTLNAIHAIAMGADIPDDVSPAEVWYDGPYGKRSGKQNVDHMSPPSPAHKKP